MSVSLLLIRFEIKDGEPLIGFGISGAAFHDPPGSKAVSFVSGNPFVEKTEGILHIYKQNTDAGTTISSSRILCILNVPAFMTSHNLLQFVAPFSSSICHIRIIRDGRPNEYMVLLYFRDMVCAEEFYRNVDGTRFNSIESDICHLVFVSRVEVMKESEGANWPISGCTELPTCSVCLERMDESVDEILTILCNHSFHGSCLSQWSDTTCPVCRYEQTPEAKADPSCQACGRKQDLWICLICGNVGCGRYADGHAEQHFQETQHTFSLEVGGQRVWDYAGDNYVHRLVQSKTDGKVVEYMHPQQTADDLENVEKVEAITLEYSYLLTNQLESQRIYFENKLAMTQQMANSEIEKIKHELEVAHEERCDLMNVVQKDKSDRQSLEKKLAALSAKLQKASAELREERDMNKCLRDNQKAYTQQISKLEAQVKQISEEKDKVRYLMNFFY
ncbi:unnamed protein product [Soboliphyme baturini]|uniref:BRCA1-associated protein n=1 Tax=Soboliphyme baturini TaxID=241478 RepID=A0A183IFH4_9BILA|nr:unnamed protein product [Soboliphyme baturini]